MTISRLNGNIKVLVSLALFIAAIVLFSLNIVIGAGGASTVSRGLLPIVVCASDTKWSGVCDYEADGTADHGGS